MQAGEAARPQDDDYFQQEPGGDEGANQGAWETAMPWEPARAAAVAPTGEGSAPGRDDSDRPGEHESRPGQEFRGRSEAESSTGDEEQRALAGSRATDEASDAPSAAGDPLSTLRRIFPGRIIDVETAEESDEGDGASSEGELGVADDMEPDAQGLGEELQEG